LSASRVATLVGASGLSASRVATLVGASGRGLPKRLNLNSKTLLDHVKKVIRAAPFAKRTQVQLR
jgi:hypothetical protein